MKDLEGVDCQVCGIKICASQWEKHIRSKIHKEKTLIQMMESRIGKEGHTEFRDETIEFLEELEERHMKD